MKQEVFEAITALRNAAFLGTDEDREKMQRAVEVVAREIDAEPCSDAISRAEAQTEIMMFAGNCKSDEEDIYIKVSDAVQLLRDLPSVHAEPRTGHWTKISPASIYECSSCGQNVMTEDIDSYRYCHGCGAKMESGKEKE